MADIERDDMPPGGLTPPIRKRPAELDEEHDDIFFAAVRTTRMPMTVTDPNLPDNPIVFANPAFMQMTGYSHAELIGRNCRFLQGPDSDPETVQAVREAVARQTEISVELLNYKKSGATFWNALFISPVYDKAGQLVYFFASQLDVSRRRDAEESLRQAQKMEAVGQLTGGVAHDFNNLLTVIGGFSDMLRNQIDRTGDFDRDRARRAVDAIIQASDRGATLTQQLLAFARKQKLKGRTINLNELVDSMRPIIERTAGGQVTVETHFSDQTCNAIIDTVQAELALINILINARDAMPDGGRISIETGIRTVDAEDQALFNDIRPGRYAMLSVTDQGTGMTPEILARVLEPFFTTKDQGKGTGLGLSMVYGFAKQSGGTIKLYSEPGHGTTVRLLFPAVDGRADLVPDLTKASRGTKGGTETILVVEDQPDVGDLAQSILEDFGYRVIRAKNAREALELLDGPTKVAMLFTDLIMPGGMNGVVLAREARRRQPRLKVLLTTGYAESSIDRVDAKGVEFDVINKPYRRTELAAKVRQLLDGPNGVS